MDLTSKKIIKTLLKKYQIRPSKYLGQNFLISKRILEKILKAANLKSNDIILEIGPGIGTLTRELAKRAKKVIAIEKDRKMIEILKETLKNFENVKIIKRDILKWKLKNMYYKVRKEESLQTPYKIVANPPYYITSSIIRKFLESEIKPQIMVLMIQKEVSQRIIAQPPKMNLLAISVQFYARPEIVSYVSKKYFWPEPKVDSAILRIGPQITRDYNQTDKDLFFRIVRAGFSHPRKQLVNSLAFKLRLEKERTQYWLRKSRISPKRRPQTLTIEDWIRLTKNFKIK